MARLIPITAAVIGALLFWTAFRVVLAYHAAAAGGVEDLERALQWLPVESRFRLLRAPHLHDHEAEAELRRAIRSAPTNSRAWMGLGVNLEVAGRSNEAFEAYRRAATFDRGAAPRAMLANFSYRHGRTADFWHWTGKAMDVPGAPTEGLLALCERLSPDGTQTWPALIERRPPLWWPYLAYWLARNRYVAARAPAEHLAPVAQPEHVPDLLHYLDFELLFGSPDLAANCWNLLAARRLIPYESLAAEANHLLTNPRLEHGPLNRGFDWRTSAVPGFVLTIAGQPREARLELTGEPARTANLFQQFLRVNPGGMYRFRCEGRMTEFPRPSVLSWAVTTTRPPVRTIAAKPVAGDEWTKYELDFVCPREGLPLRVVLTYEASGAGGRPAGVARFRSFDLIVLRGGGS